MGLVDLVLSERGKDHIINTIVICVHERKTSSHSQNHDLSVCERGLLSHSWGH